MRYLAVCFFCLAAAALHAFEYRVLCGDYDGKITETFKHTIREFKYKGYTIGTRSGFYGTIVVNKPGGYIGAGHKEGGVEQLISARVFADGKEVIPAAGKVISGKEVIIDKISMFDKARFFIRLRFTPDGVVEQKKFITVDEQRFYAFYSHQYCWDKLTTHWFALDSNGKALSGEFSHKKVAWHCNKTVKYIAQYNAAEKLGIMMYYPQIIPGAIRRSTIWEVPKAYNKYYMMTAVPKVCSKNFASPEYIVILKGFAAGDAAACPAELTRCAAELKNFKVPALPGEIK